MKMVDKMSARELRSELRQTRALLAHAKCPNNKCRAAGDVGKDHRTQCQWCTARFILIGHE